MPHPVLGFDHFTLPSERLFTRQNLELKFARERSSKSHETLHRPRRLVSRPAYGGKNCHQPRLRSSFISPPGRVRESDHYFHSTNYFRRAKTKVEVGKSE